MNKLITTVVVIGAFSLGVFFSADIANAAKPITEVIVTNPEPIPVTGLVASSGCPIDKVQHWTNVEADPLTVMVHDTEPNIQDKFFIPIPTSGDEIIDMQSIRPKIAERLNELGYTDFFGGFPISKNDIGFVALSPGYSTICTE